MIRLLIVFSLLSCGYSFAQDFTDEIQKEITTEQNENVLVIPFKSQFLLSEIDRGLVNHTGKDVFEIRDDITQDLVNQTASFFPDSISCRALDRHLESSNLSFIYHQLSFGYAEIPVSEEDKKKFSLKRKLLEKTKKEENKNPKSYHTHITGGQIAKDPVFHERYMSAEIKTPEFLEFVKNEYQADIIVILTELDLMKSPVDKAVDDYEYLASLHYVIFDGEGEKMEGNKIEKYFNKSEFDLSQLQTNVLKPMSQSIHDRTILYLSQNLPEEKKVDDKDY